MDKKVDRVAKMNIKAAEGYLAKRSKVLGEMHGNAHYGVQGRYMDDATTYTNFATTKYEDAGDVYMEGGDYKKALMQYTKAQKLVEGVKEYTPNASQYRDVFKDLPKKIEEAKAKRVERVKGYLEERKQRTSGLEKATATASIVGVLGGIFFLSTNVTGNAIADMTTKTTSFLGAGLLIVGLVAGFFWVKSRKK